MPLNESGRTKTVLWMACLLLLAADGQARANGARPDALRDIGFDQRLGVQVPLELRFREEQGTSVELSEYFRSKPIILMVAYYNCPNLCPLALESLVKSLKAISFDAGKEFHVLIVSIDPNEGPALATANKEKYLQKYGRPGAERGWHFLTGEEVSIKQLTAAAGFRYTYDAEKDRYAHASGIIILTRQGRISRYLYGIEYPPRDVRLGLVEASAGKIGSPVDQLLLLCYQYDPATGKYTLVVTNVLRLAGLGTALGLGSYVLIMVRRERLGRAKTDKKGIQNV